MRASGTPSRTVGRTRGCGSDTRRGPDSVSWARPSSRATSYVAVGRSWHGAAPRRSVNSTWCRSWTRPWSPSRSRPGASRRARHVGHLANDWIQRRSNVSAGPPPGWRVARRAHGRHASIWSRFDWSALAADWNSTTRPTCVRGRMLLTKNEGPAPGWAPRTQAPIDGTRTQPGALDPPPIRPRRFGTRSEPDGWPEPPCSVEIIGHPTEGRPPSPPTSDASRRLLAASRWAVGGGRWALGAGRWAVGGGCWQLDRCSLTDRLLAAPPPSGHGPPTVRPPSGRRPFRARSLADLWPSCGPCRSSVPGISSEIEATTTVPGLARLSPRRGTDPHRLGSPVPVHPGVVPGR